MCMVYESVILLNSPVLEKVEDYAWENECEGVLSILWDIINGQEITSTRFPARMPLEEETTGNQGSGPGAKPKGCSCKPRNDGRCCVSRACACRKSEEGPHACSSSCACQKLIKRQQEQQRQQGDGDQNLVECANPATTASVIQAAAAELFAAAHNPPQPASGNEEDNPGSSSEKAVDLCNTSDSDSEQDVGDQGEADACDSDSSTDREA